jgi:hypothetical protein
MAFVKPTAEQLATRFGFHSIKGDQGDRYCQMRASIKQMAISCVDLTPCCAEQTRL